MDSGFWIIWNHTCTYQIKKFVRTNDSTKRVLIPSAMLRSSCYQQSHANNGLLSVKVGSLQWSFLQVLYVGNFHYTCILPTLFIFFQCDDEFTHKKLDFTIWKFRNFFYCNRYPASLTVLNHHDFEAATLK